MASSTSHGILGQKLLDGKTKTIYAVIDQPRLVCIQRKDYPNALVNRRMSTDYTFRFNNIHQTRAGTEITPKGVLMTSITTCVYEILREVSIPIFYVATHPQPDMFIAQKCTMIPMAWTIRRVADEQYVKRHPEYVNGHRFIPPLIEVYYKRRAMINRRLTLGTLDDHLEIDRENQIDEGADEEEEESEELMSSIWSYEQLLNTHFDHDNLKLSQTDLEYMYEISCAVFDILEHVWMVEKNCQLTDLKLEFGITTTATTREIVLANTFDLETWHIVKSTETAASNGNDLVHENLTWINNCLRDILNLNINSSSNPKMLPDDDQQSYSIVPEDEEENVSDISATSFSSSVKSRCVIVCASLLDVEHGQTIKNSLNEVYNIECDIRLYSICKSTHTILRFLSKYTYEHRRPTVFVTLGNMNNGLAMCLSSNSQYPVIHCSLTDKELQNHVVDINSFTSNDTSLFTVVFTLSSAVQNVAQILANHDWKLWAKQRGRRFKRYLDLIIADLQLTVTQTTMTNSGLLINR